MLYFSYNWKFLHSKQKSMAVVSIVLDEADKNLLLNMRDNINFLAARSLTRTAQDIQQKVQAHIRESFVIRKKSGGFEKSVRIKPATKQNLQTEVYTMAAFAALQQTGGPNKAHSGRLAIPLYNDLREVKPKAKSNSPQNLKNSFLIKLKSGGYAVAIRKSKEMKVMYVLKQLAYVPKRLTMLEIGESLAAPAFALHFKQDLS